MKEKTAKNKFFESRLPFGKYLKEQLKTRPAVTAVMALYIGFALASCVYFAVIGRWRDSLLSVGSAVTVPVIYGAEYFTRQRCPIIFVALTMLWMFGSFIGACYNVYTYLPWWDDFMHFLWGVVFAGTGFAVIKLFMGEPDSNKKFFGCLAFAFAFGLTIGVFWEIYEFSVDRLIPSYDMQEDTIINSIHSFFLHKPYDHLHTEVIEGIEYTVIYLSDGSTYTIEGGYLDVGLMDTMWDTIWCTVSAAALCVALIIDRFCGKRFYKLMIPAEPKKAVESVEPVADVEPVDIADAENVEAADGNVVEASQSDETE